MERRTQVVSTGGGTGQPGTGCPIRDQYNGKRIQPRVGRLQHCHYGCTEMTPQRGWNCSTAPLQGSLSRHYSSSVPMSSDSSWRQGDGDGISLDTNSHQTTPRPLIALLWLSDTPPPTCTNCWRQATSMPTSWAQRDWRETRTLRRL